MSKKRSSKIYQRNGDGKINPFYKKLEWVDERFSSLNTTKPNIRTIRKVNEDKWVSLGIWDKKDNNV